MIMKILLIVAFLFIQHPGNPPNIPPGCNNPVPEIKNPNCDVDQVPLSGLEWLAVAGGIYGIRKLKQKERRNCKTRNN